MVKQSLVCAVTVGIIGLTAAASGHAQTRIEAGPLIALYAPAGSFQPAPYYSTALPNSPADLGGVAWGAQGRLWVNERFGVQLQAAVAGSSVGGGNTPAGSLPATPARVLTASAQALIAVTPRSRSSRLWLSAGTGLVEHAGRAFARYGSPVQFATTFGFGAAVSFRGHFGASFGMTAFLYNIDVSDSTGTSLEHGFQFDPLIHLGFELR